eukprot:GGOE01040742.1.p1 GENE.GGOE01040742.1~~GGOE01040742.1.p1  ORF type:complete len:224 (+),score=84.03 GGOE01040742.1:39-674(+)
MSAKRHKGEGKKAATLPGLTATVLNSVEVHIAEVDGKINNVINVKVPACIQEVQEAQKRSYANCQERQRMASTLHTRLVEVTDDLCHWIAMKQERIECGNEFGSEVQATVAGALIRNVSNSSERKENMASVLLDSLNLDVPKYEQLRGSELHSVLKDSLARDHEVMFERFLEDLSRTYYRVLRLLFNNRAALVDPKNGSGHSTSLRDQLFA